MQASNRISSISVERPVATSTGSVLRCPLRGRTHRGVSDFTATRGGNRCAAQPSGAAPLRTVDGLTQVITTNSNERTSSGVTFGPVTAESLRDHQTGFTSLLKEYAYWVQDSWVTGTIPPELYGTYFRNGPGLQVSNPRYKRHHFDGDGMVLSLAFREGRAYWRNRFVRTKGFVDEQAAGRPLYRNAFTQGSADGSLFFNPFDLQFKNVANTGVLRWAGQLYALWEGGLPHAMDPTSLDTLGETTLGGQLATNSLTAHYRVTTEPDGSRRWVSFSMDTGFGGTSAIFYEFDEQGRKVHETKHGLEGVSLALVHDMLVSEHYYALIMGPVEFSPKKFATEYLFSRCSIAECLEYNPGGRTRVVLVPRPGRASGRKLRVRELYTDPCFVFHHVNAYEAEYPAGTARPDAEYDEPIVVLDTMRIDEITFTVNQYSYTPDYYKGGPRTQLYRMVCDLRSGAVSETRLMRRTGEFPATDPRVVGRPHTATWVGCDMVDDNYLWGNLQGIARVQLDPTYGLPAGATVNGLVAPGTGSGYDNPRAATTSAPVVPGAKLDVWAPGKRCYIGEPIFVPRPGSSVEGDGWLIVPTHNAESLKGEVHILEANSLERGPVATIRLPHIIPNGLHGSWDVNYVGPDPQDRAVPQWQELGTIRPM